MKYYYSSGIKGMRGRWHRYRHVKHWRLSRRPQGLIALVVIIGAAIILPIVFSIPQSLPHQGVRPAPAAPKTRTNPAQSRYGLAVGDTLAGLSDTQLATELTGIAATGAKWIRLDVSWADIQPQSAQQYNWSTLDRIVAAANQRHLHILSTLAYTPPWARPSDCSSEKCAPANPHQFAAFAAAATSRYASKGMQDWEIWNEPNLEGFWQPAPNPADYTHLLQASYTAIRKVEPSATVLSGGLGSLDSSSASINEVTFLADMYEVGAKPYFDAVGYHPYSFPALPSQVASWSSWSMMADLPQSIRSVMTANGDSAKQIWITEFGAPTDGPGALATPTEPNFALHPDHVSDTLQAEMVTDAITQYQKTSWLGAFFWYTYQDAGTSSTTNEIFFGLLSANGTPKPAYTAFRNAIQGY